MMDLPLKTLDCICTRSESFVGDVIRFFTKKRVKGASNVANHCGLIIYIEGIPMVMEMLGTGLELNPVSDYDNYRDRIVAVKRLPFTDDQIRDARRFLLSTYWSGSVQYSYKELLKFPTFCKRLGFEKVASTKMYCSEFCEIIAQKYNLSWVDNATIGSGIAPIDIQFGKGETVWQEKSSV